MKNGLKSKDYFDSDFLENKIRYVMRDDSYDPARTRATVIEMVGNEGVFAFAGGVGTAPGMAVPQYLIENGVPWVNSSTGSTHWTFPQSKYIFSVFPLYSDEAAILSEYAVNQLGKKIAIFYENDDYGNGGVYGIQIKLESLGILTIAPCKLVVLLYIELLSLFIS